MHRLISALGTLLVIAGVAILAYIGVTYAHPASPSVATWSQAQKQQGRLHAARLNTRQRVTIPHVLGNARLPAPGAAATRIVIPKIGVDSPVVQTQPVNGAWEVADWSVGHLTTTPNPGLPGNGAYAAHDDIKGELFKREPELVPGDTVLVYTPHVIYHYTVINQQTVDPSNVSVLAPTRQPTVTLISCIPYWVDTQRVVVQAVLKSRSAI
jgi:LPXTG-site transpeptidase (sortase) family protein